MDIKKLLFTGALALTLIVCATDRTEAASDKPASSTVESVETGRFIDIFRKQYKSDLQSSGVEKRFAAAKAYIESCCKTQEDVASLLESNGFKVKVYTGLDGELPTRHGKIKYDSLVGGTRGPGWARFWQITTTYRADIYFRAGKVASVSAMVDTAMP